MLDECGKIVIDPKCVGNLINKNFVDIADKLLKERKDVVDIKNEEYLSDLLKIILSSTNFLIVRLRIISKLRILIKVCIMMSLGECFLKLRAKIISSYLSKLYKICVEYGLFPESLKFAEVILIYKSGK